MTCNAPKKNCERERERERLKKIIKKKKNL